MADAACMQRVADIIDRDKGSRLGVVLSACRGVTDALLALITQAERQQPVDDAVIALRERHVEIARALIPGTSADAYTEVLDRDCQDISGILHAVHLTRSASSAVRDLVAGFGEVWSTRLFALEIQTFPTVVIIDRHGGNFHETARARWRRSR